MYNIDQLTEMLVSELREVAQKLGIPDSESLKKQELIYKILDSQTASKEKPKEEIKDSPKETAPEQESNTSKIKLKRKRIILDEPISNLAETPDSEIVNESEKVTTIESNTPSSEKKEESINETSAPVSSTSELENVGNISPKPFVNKPVFDSNYDFGTYIISEGVLDLMPEGFGYLRSSDFNYLTSPDDIYVSQSQVKLFGLKTGDTVRGSIRPPKDGEKYFPLIKVDLINGQEPSVVRDRVPFEHLTPLFPFEKINLSGTKSTLSTQIGRAHV